MARYRIAILALTTLLLIGGIGAWFFLQPSPAPAPIQHAQPAPPPVPAPTAAPKAAPTSSDLILDLFQPSDDALQQQHSTTELSSQIENAMVVSYTLVQCKLISQQEYAATFNALIMYATQMHLEPDAEHAEAHVRALASAAAGSYSMVYSHTPCTDPGLPEKATALKAWRDAVINHH